eukprot:895744-Prorocentrum_minimum.AAC.1
MDAKGYRVDVKGYIVDVKGYSVDAKGYMVDVKGYCVDAKGYRVICDQYHCGAIRPRQVHVHISRVGVSKVHHLDRHTSYGEAVLNGEAHVGGLDRPH